MKPLALIAVMLVAGASLAARAEPAASVETRFVNPNRFTDFRVDRWRDARQTQALADELSRWIAHSAQPHLPPGSKLTVTITDVDMAGEFEPWQRTDARDIRVVKESYPSRVNLSFTLADAAGNVVREGERKLVTTMLFNRSTQDGPLRYEKLLLRDWLAREFGR